MKNSILKIVKKVTQEKGNELAEWVEKWISEGMKGGLSELEKKLRSFGAAIEKAGMKEALEMCPTGYEGNRAICKKCGNKARYKGMHDKIIKTMQGEQKIKRAYYWCGICRNGFCPLDYQLKLELDRFSPELRKLVVELAGYIPPENIPEYIYETREVVVSEDSIRRCASKAGVDIEKMRWTEWSRKGSEKPKTTRGAKNRIYTGVDATSVNIRGEGWKQPKMSVSFEYGKERIIDRRYAGGFYDVGQFGRMWGWSALELQRNRLAEFITLGDGANWIWNLAGEYFEGSVQIVDWYHAKERLYTIGKLVFGEHSPKASEWSKKQASNLWSGKIQRVIKAIKKLKPKGKQAKDYVKQSIGYYTSHSLRMQYSRFRDKGYTIGSGIVEGGACKNVIGDRMKRAGMRWSKKGAHSMIQLRCALLDKTIKNFWSKKYAIN